jgi:MFS superfamily sulfate permease-like transporter
VQHVHIFVSLLCVLQFRQWLVPDALAGITVGVMAVPQAMSYALVAGLPAKYGLYTSFYPMMICTCLACCCCVDPLPLPSAATSILCLEIAGLWFADAFFGTSIHLVSGPTAVVSLLVRFCAHVLPRLGGLG